MSTVTLRDVDNRDADGAPFVLEGTLEQAIAYIDGPVRRDVVPGAEYRVDDVLAKLRADHFDVGADLARRTLGVYLSQSESSE